LKNNNIDPKDITAIGITNQREPTVVWNKLTGKPIYNAIVWQDRRTAPICDRLKEIGLESYVKENTGLVVDAYFSGTKINWILEHIEGARELAESGKLLFGTIDSWLVWKLTNGKHHITEVSNASRTMIFNIRTLTWDSTMLEALNIPKKMLPDVRSSSEIYGTTESTIFDGVEIRIAGIAGDQQSALFGQACTKSGMAKNTYGTGCFMLMNTGNQMVPSKNGLLTTIAWKIGDEVKYALEGSIFIGGAVIQWLRDGLGILDAAEESEKMANEVEDSGGVVIIPAFTGLGAPHWDMYARGSIYGITRGTDKRHITRAALESIAFQSMEVLKAMEEDSGIRLNTLRVDGGACANNFLMQFQSDILNVPVERPRIIETTALGAAFLAGLATGFYTIENIENSWQLEKRFIPLLSNEERLRHTTMWNKAIDRTKKWLESDII